ncbi:unnamed protein product, partial [Lymnaea stagnalis]
SKSFLEDFLTYSQCVVAAVVNFGGIVGNVINLVVFAKMGFHETINISLFSLAASDLGCLVTLQWTYLCYNPLFRAADLPFNAVVVEYITGGWPHVGFSRVAGMLTAYATFERCLCVTLPMDVKRLLTPKKTVCVVAAIFVLVFASITPVFTVNLLLPEFYPPLNKTWVGIVFTGNRAEVEQVLFSMTNIYGYMSFVLVALFTVVLINRLIAKTKWRDDVIFSHTRTSTVSMRDKKVARMMATVSCLFITLTFPLTAVYLTSAVMPDFGRGGILESVFQVSVASAISFEMINSSVNVLVYLKMSSRYKEVVVKLFLR